MFSTTRISLEKVIMTWPVSLILERDASGGIGGGGGM